MPPPDALDRPHRQTPDRELRPFFDDLGRLRAYPARRRLQLKVLAHLADRLESGRIYTEREINVLLDDAHTFRDPARLRRALVDWSFVGRERDGSRYWLITTTPP